MERKRRPKQAREPGEREMNTNEPFDIALVQLPLASPAQPPMWLGCLHAYLGQSGISSKPMDMSICAYHEAPAPLRWPWLKDHPDGPWEHPPEAGILGSFSTLIDEQVQLLSETPADILGFHLSHLSMQWTVETIRRLREHGDRRPVVVGGPAVWTRADWPTLPWDLIDYAVVGEGEQALAALIRSLLTGRQSSTIPGVVFPPGSPERFRPRPPLQTLELLPIPDFSDLPLDLYLDRSIPISSSRGCMHRCAFCSDQPFWGPLRSRSVQSVLGEMKHRVSEGCHGDFAFTDLVLGQEAGWLEDLADRLDEEGLGVRWRARVLSGRDMTKTLFRKLAATGCTDLEFCFEAVGPAVNDNMNRPLEVPVLRDVLSWSAAAGIENHIHLMVGVPGDDEGGVECMLGFIRENASSIASVVSADVCAVTPQSPLEREAHRYGVVLPPEGHYLSWFHPTTRGFNERLSWLVGLLSGIDELGFSLPRGHLTESARAALNRCRDGESDHGTGAGCADTASQDSSQDRHEYFRERRLRSSKGKVAVCGPVFLELELTNNCNSDCIACWCHSHLLGEKRLRADEKRQSLPFDTVKRVLDQAWSHGVETIQLSGAGEPMLHPRFHDIVRHIKSLGMKVHLITNFTLVDEAAISSFVELGIDHITASIWAGSPETYQVTHPTAPSGTFERMDRMMSLLRDEKTKRQSILPQLKVYHVVLTKNSHELRAMVEFARRGFAAEVEFTIVDVVPGKTDSLGLDERHCRSILEQFESLRPGLDYPLPLGTDHLSALGQEELVHELQEFGRMLHDLPDDFVFDETRQHLCCPQGQQAQVVHIDEEPGRFLRYQFDAARCASCLRRDRCPVPASENVLDLTFMSIRGAGSFSRRITDTMENKTTDAGLIDRFPCYAGWIYMRVRANGDVIPCCKAVNMPMGNILQDGFDPIWFGRRMNEFRVLARDLPKSAPYFAPIRCYEGCDNLGMNLAFHREVVAHADSEDGQIERQVDR